MNKLFKPELLPNNKAGDPIDILKIVTHPEDWLWSNKADGARVEIPGSGLAVGRSLKEITSVHVQAMVKDIQLLLQFRSDVVIEAEFYSPEMNFAEIMHFFRSSDVTSEKSCKHWANEWSKTKQGTATYTKMVKGVPVEQEWPFEGRDIYWVTTWHPSLKLYAFNYIDTSDHGQTKELRSKILNISIQHYNAKMLGQVPDLIELKQNEITHVDELYQAYDQALLDGYEGVVIFRKDCQYKFGRHSLKSGNTYKLKNDDCEFDGLITGVEEGTVAIEGAAKTINELGRSVTSKLKEDRQPSGMAKGLMVLMEDGNKLTVSLKGFDHPARIRMLNEPLKWIGETIRFTGAPAVKPGGKPRHAHFTKGNIRDAK